MVFGDGTFRSRAASLLRPSTLLNNQALDANRESGTPDTPLNEERSQHTEQTEFEQAQTTSLGGKTYHSSGPNAVGHNRDAQRSVRAIPGQ